MVRVEEEWRVAYVRREAQCKRKNEKTRVRERACKRSTPTKIETSCV